MLSVIIPCFNEEANLQHLFVKVVKFLKSVDGSEVVLVNNGSSDGSLKLLNEFKLTNHGLEIKICNVKENQGYGNGILKGLEIATRDILAWTHADLQTDVMDCAKALEVYKNNKSHKNILVKGFRKNRKWNEVLLSYGMSFLASIKLKSKLIEVNAQPKLFSKSFFELIKNDAPKDFSLDLYFHYKANKLGRVVTFPVLFLPRIAGEAKGGSGSSFKTKVKIIKRTIAYIDKLKTIK